jgi:hypothetical protein
MEETCFFTNTFASHRSSRPQIQKSGKVEHSQPKKNAQTSRPEHFFDPDHPAFPKNLDSM